MQRWFLRIVLALSLANVSACAAQRADLPGVEIGDWAPAHGGALRVMSFNVKSCAGGLDEIAAAIRAARPDVVALQEVDNGTSRSGGLDQASELARRLDLPYSAHIPATRMHGGAYGMALLSRIPVKALNQRALPVDRGMEPRVVAHAILEVGGQEVSLYKAHLSPMPQRSRLRREQASMVARLIAADHRPSILVGDMNDVANSPAVRLLTNRMQDSWATAGVGSAGTYPLPLLGTFRFDYVFASSDFEVLRSFVLPGNASDHYPVVADLELPRTVVADSEPIVADSD